MEKKNIFTATIITLVFIAFFVIMLFVFPEQITLTVLTFLIVLIIFFVLSVIIIDTGNRLDNMIQKIERDKDRNREKINDEIL